MSNAMPFVWEPGFSIITIVTLSTLITTNKCKQLHSPQLPSAARQLQKLFTSVAFTCLGQPPGIDEMDLPTVFWSKPSLL